MSKRKPHHEEHADETWLVPYSDLLTLLLALFIVLYALSAVNAEKFQKMSQAFSVAFSSSGGSGVLDQSAMIQTGDDADGKSAVAKMTKEQQEESEKMMQELKNLKSLQSSLDSYIEEKQLTSQLSTQLNYSELLITIKDLALFSSGSAQVKQEGEDLALAISQMFKKYPNYQVVVAGHTDTNPISTVQFPSNWELSSARAMNFMKLLLQKGELDPKYFSSTGYGEYRPIADNATDTGRAQNRRVEVSIIRKYKKSNS